MPLPFIASKTAGKAYTEGMKALQADLLVVRGKSKPRRKGELPIDWEAHVNPMGIGVLAVGLGLALWLTQQRIGYSQAQYGQWRWPDGTNASREMPKSKMGTPPTRPTTEGVVHTGDPFVPYTYNVERATWFDTGMKSVYGLRERQGFLGNGSGTTTTDLVKEIGLGGWWSPWW